MGYRLTLYVLPKTEAKKLWNMTTYEQANEVLDKLEKIVHDYCTDAMIDVRKQMKRVTKAKLDIECDCWMGKMNKELFMVFLDKIKWYAERQIKESPDPLTWWPYIRESDDKWKLCNTIDWIGAYFQGWYIFKQMDWDNNYIYATMG